MTDTTFFLINEVIGVKKCMDLLRMGIRHLLFDLNYLFSNYASISIVTLEELSWESWEEGGKFVWKEKTLTITYQEHRNTKGESNI